MGPQGAGMRAGAAGEGEGCVNPFVPAQAGTPLPFFVRPLGSRLRGNERCACHPSFSNAICIWESRAGARHRPYYRRRGGAVFHSPPQRGLLFVPRQKCRGDGAPQGALSVRAFAARAPFAKGARPAALHRGFSVPGAVLPGGMQGRPFGLPLSGGLPPAFDPAHVQPFKAAGLSAGGRLARASRGVLARHTRGRRTCPTSRSPLEAPLIGQVKQPWRMILAEL